MGEQSSDTAASASALTDDHHDWASAFCGIDTRATASSESSSSGGGLWDSLKDAASGALDTVENVASDVGSTVKDAASGIASTVETVATDVGHTALDVGKGVLNTAEKVGGDVVSGNFGQALGDAADGAVSTAGHALDDAAHTVVDAGSGLLDTAGKVVAGGIQTAAHAATGVISTAGKVAGGVAHTVAQAAGPDSLIGRAANAAGGLATTAAGVAVDAVNTTADFDKGVVEGVAGGVEGMAKGVVSLGEGVAKEGYALATDEKARESALETVEHGAEAVGNFEVNLVTDPSKAFGQVEGAVGSAVDSAETMASGVYKGYQAAAAQGHGAEYIGKGVGQAAVVVAGAVLTDGAALGAEAGAEGAGLLGEAAEVAGEGTAILGDGAAAGGEAGALASEGTAAGEAAETAAAGTSEAGEAGAGAGGGANPEINRPTYTPDPETPVPQGPGTSPTEFPSDPTQYPQPPGPAPDIPPGEPNPYEPYNPGQPPMNPNIPRPPRVPEITPDPTRLPPGATPGPGAAAGEAADAAGADAAVAEDMPGWEQPESSRPSASADSSEPGLGELDDDAPSEVEQEFNERQEHYGQAQLEVDDAPPSSDLEEPNRMQELDSGHDPTWQREGADDRLAAGKRENPFTPADHRGSWKSGNPGNGRWAPNNPGEYGLEEGQSVPFVEGTPDFTEFAPDTPAGNPGTLDVEGLTGDSAADRAATVKALAEREGMEPEAIEQWLSDNQLRLHHFGGKEMQAVPRRLHELFHEGGASELRGLDDARDVAQRADQAMAEFTKSNPAAGAVDTEFDEAEAAREGDLFGEGPKPNE